MSPGKTTEAQRAHSIVQNAITFGRLKRAKECEQCGPPRWSTTIIVAHHDDYSMPLDVRWLCVSCHRRHHIALSKAAGTYTKPGPRIAKARRIKVPSDFAEVRPEVAA